MKKVVNNSGLGRLLPLIMFLFTCCLTTGALQSQTPQTESQVLYNWKSEADARAIMLAQVKTLNDQMPGFTEGTPLYENALRRVAYFKAIIYEIDRGTNVEQSLVNAIPAAATLGYSKEASYTSKVVLRALQEEARVMLTN
jgi:hypothetical protein